MTEEQSKHLLAPLSDTQFGYVESVRYVQEDAGGRLEVLLEMGGSLVARGFAFEKVRASRFRAESHCDAWLVQGAYCALVEVVHSRWVEELRVAERGYNGSIGRVMKHFLIYVEDHGAYEVVAAAAERLAVDPPKPGLSP